MGDTQLLSILFPLVSGMGVSSPVLLLRYPKTFLSPSGLHKLFSDSVGFSLRTKTGNDRHKTVERVHLVTVIIMDRVS